MSFWDAHFLWLEIVIAAAAIGAATAAVGVHTTLRRVVFLPAALSQLAGAGVVVAFLLVHLVTAPAAHHDSAEAGTHPAFGHENSAPAGDGHAQVDQSDSAIPMADDPGVFTDDSAIPMADDPGVFTDDSAIPMADDPGVFSGEDDKDGASVAAAADHHGGEKPAVEAAGNVSGEALGSVGGSDWVAGHEPCDNTWSLPWLMALLFACAGALILGFVREGRQVTRGWLLGAVFVAASGAVLLLGGFIQQEMHDVNDVLFGNAIAISTDQMWQAIMVAALVLALHVWLAPLFLSYAFDPVTARAHGFPVQLLDAVLFLSMGLAIASGTRVVGALPEFAFAVFPGMAALSLVRKARWLMVVAALFGAASAFVGYWASFVLSLPTGATMAAAALALTLLARVAGRVLHRS